MSEKLKNTPTIGRMTFFVAWVVIIVIGAFIGQLLFGSLRFVFSTDFLSAGMNINIVSTIITFTVYAIVGYLQTYAIYRWKAIQIPRWWWMTGLSFAVGNLVLNTVLYIQTSATYTVPILIICMIIQLGLVGVAQASLLQAYFKRVWVYVLVTCGIGAMSGFFLINLPQFASMGTVIYGASTGLTLLWLDHITHEKEKVGDSNHIVEA